MSSDAPRRPRSNLLALATTRAVMAGTGLLVNLALARWLPREIFGTYRWIWAVVSVATFGASLGLGAYVTREVARDGGAARRLVPAGLRAVLGLSTLTGVGIVSYVALRDGRPEVVAAAVLAALTLAAQAGAQITTGALHGLRQMARELPAVLVGRSLFVAGHLGVAAAGMGLGWLYGARALAAGVTLGVLWVSLRRLVGPSEPVAPGAVRQLVSVGGHFGATVLFGAIYAQADLLMLELLADHEEVARYAAPATILLQLALVASTLSRGIFPRLARRVGDRAGAADVITFQTRMLLWISAPVAAGGLVVGPELVPWLFGEAYRDAVLPFAWLVVAVPVRFLNAGLGLSLTALDRQRRRARIDGVGAVFNVVANALAIPWLGAVGAAITTLVTDVVLLGLLRWQVGRVTTGLSLWGPAWRTLVPAVAMGLVVEALPEAHVLVDIVVGALVYAALSWGTGGWSRADLRRLRRV